MITDNDIISKLKTKDPLALEYLLNTYGNFIYKVSYMSTNNKELSEECVNDVLLKIWNSIDSFNSDHSKFKNWIGSITKHTSIDLIRKKKITKISDIDNFSISSQENLEENYITKCELNIIKNYLCELKEIDKHIMIERFFYNSDLKIISKKYNISENAINLRIMRIRRKLKSHMNSMEV
ncbi:MAG: sigma-70 family RNA polymerase sigma factor [Clostridium chrysemydis]|uniref:sigma-70 family RNA polymerase sigma factor n=1 Tax=Clostridium chrysemydis TaxID=2665504 RepID=UPI003F350D15